MFRFRALLLTPMAHAVSPNLSDGLTGRTLSVLCPNWAERAGLARGSGSFPQKQVDNGVLMCSAANHGFSARVSL